MKEITGVPSQASFHRHNVTQTQSADQAGNAKHGLNPAKAARAALAERPDLAGKPFGHLVSLFARGLPLPAAEIVEPVEPVTETTETPSVTPETTETPSE